MNGMGAVWEGQESTATDVRNFDTSVKSVKLPDENTVSEVLKLKRADLQRLVGMVPGLVGGRAGHSVQRQRTLQETLPCHLATF